MQKNFDNSTNRSINRSDFPLNNNLNCTFDSSKQCIVLGSPMSPVKLQTINDLDIIYDNNNPYCSFDFSVSSQRKSLKNQNILESKMNQKVFHNSNRLQGSDLETLQSKIKEFNEQQSQKAKIEQQNKINQLKWNLSKLVLVSTYVRTFISKIQQRLQGKQALRKLQKEQIKQIGDKSFVFRKQKIVKGQIVYGQAELDEEEIIALQKTKTQKKKCFFIRMLQCIPIFYPNQSFKILSDCWIAYWVVFRMFFTTIKFFYYPFKMAESIDMIKSYTLYVINFSFIVDMILSMHTGYYDNGVIVLDRFKIIKKYISTTFFYDLFAYIPIIGFFFVSKDSDQQIIVITFLLEVLIFLKSVSLKKTYQRIERVFTESEVFADYWPLINLFVNICILAHIVGISYFVVALVQIEYFNEDKTWLHDQDLIDKHWFEQYINSLYWSFSTMVSNVYYTPVTLIELIFTIFAILVMTGMFGYVLNTIGMLLNDIEKKTKKYKLLREMANRLMKKKHIPELLRERVSIYLDYIQQEEKQKNQQEEDLILGIMSDQLRKELLQHMNQQYLKQFSVINDYFSEQTQKETLLIIKEQVFSAGDVIFSEKNRSLENQNEDPLSIYVLLKGTVELCYVNKETQKTIIAERITKGQIFGAREFFTGEDRSITARSFEACSVIKIDRSTFQDIINSNSDDKQTFLMIRDQILLYNTSTDYLDLKCGCCNQSGHIPKNCQLIHYNINLKQLIYDYNHYDIQIKRNECQRYEEKSLNALLDLEYIQYGVEEIFDQENGAYEEAFHLQCQLQQQNLQQSNNDIRRGSQVKKNSKLGANQPYIITDIIQNSNTDQNYNVDNFNEHLLEIKEHNQELEQSQLPNKQVMIQDNYQENIDFSSGNMDNNQKRRSSVSQKKNSVIKICQNLINNKNINEQNSKEKHISQNINKNNNFSQKAAKKQSLYIDKTKQKQFKQQHEEKIIESRRKSQQNKTPTLLAVQNNGQIEGLIDLNSTDGISQIRAKNPSSLGQTRVANQEQKQYLGMRKESKNGNNTLIQLYTSQNKNQQIAVKDIDLEGFDKLQNWNVYWTQHNYENLQNDEKIRHYFIVTEYFTDKEVDKQFTLLQKYNNSNTLHFQKGNSEFQKSFRQQGDSTLRSNKSKSSQDFSNIVLQSPSKYSYGQGGYLGQSSTKKKIGTMSPNKKQNSNKQIKSGIFKFIQATSFQMQNPKEQKDQEQDQDNQQTKRATLGSILKLNIENITGQQIQSNLGSFKDIFQNKSPRKSKMRTLVSKKDKDLNNEKN